MWLINNRPKLLTLALFNSCQKPRSILRFLFKAIYKLRLLLKLKILDQNQILKLSFVTTIETAGSYYITLKISSYNITRVTLAVRPHTNNANNERTMYEVIF